MPTPNVARWTDPNYTTQSAAAYKAALDAAHAVAKRGADWFAPHQTYSASPNPDLSVELDAGYIWDGLNLTEVAAQIVTGFTIPSAGQNRVDRVVVDASTGVASRVEGTAVTGSPTATAPAIPAGKIPICQVTITSADTVITNSMITDERPLVQAQKGIPAGAIIEYAGNGSGSPDAPPSGYLFCNGANVSRTTYAELFSAIGTTWGAGDGSTTFTLPDSRRRVAVGAGGEATATLGNSVGSTGGAETVTLTSTEMPPHTHTTDSQGSHTHTPSGGGSFITNASNSGPGFQAASNPNGTSASTSSNGAHTHTAQSTGSGGAHNNIQPSYVVQKIIKT